MEKMVIEEKIRTIPADRLDISLSLAEKEFEFQDRCRVNLRGRIQALLLVLASALSAMGLFLYKNPDTTTALCLSAPAVLWFIACSRLYPIVMSRSMIDPYGDVLDNVFRDNDIDDLKRRKIYHLRNSADDLSKATIADGRVFNGCLMVSVVGAFLLVAGVLSAALASLNP